MLVDEWPALGTDSTTQMNFLLIEELSQRGQDVVVLKPSREGSESVSQELRREALSRMAHVQTRTLASPRQGPSLVRQLIPEGLRWSRRRWYWQLQCRDELDDVIRAKDVSLIFAYGDTGLAWLASTVENPQRRVILGDRPDLPYMYHQSPPFQGLGRFFSPSWWVRWILVWQLRRDFFRLIQCLRDMECVSAAYAQYIQGRGFNARYCRSAVVPAVPSPVEADRLGLNLLVLGNLSGTANFQGCVELARNLAPSLVEDLSSGTVRIRVVGHGASSIPPRDLKALKQLGVEVVGFVEDLEEQYTWADALLIPTTLPLGVRIRTVEGWSRGLPTIGHLSIADGLPESQDRYNCLLARDAQHMAAIVRDLARDPAQIVLLKASAAVTFRTWFSRRAQELAEEMITA